MTVAERVRPLERLYPGYFALVMATGIVSTVLSENHHPRLSGLLLGLAVVSGVALTVLYAVRLVVFPAAFVADLVAPERTFAFFTVVAACNVVGVRLGLDGHRAVTVALLVVSAAVWLPLSYAVPARLILGPRPGSVLAGVNGTWFIWVVGTQSLAVAAAVLEHRLATPQARALALVAVLMWSVGVVLYLIVAGLVLIRLLLLEVRPDDLSPPYWIAMGATAITVLAAARLLEVSPTPVTVATRPVVTGLAVMLWAFGSWLVPMLAVFTTWRYTARHVPLHYAPPLWSIVFPLGMYSTASTELGRAAHLPLLTTIGHATAWVAVLAWAGTALLFVVAVVQVARGAPGPAVVDAARRPPWRGRPRRRPGTRWRATTDRPAARRPTGGGARLPSPSRWPQRPAPGRPTARAAARAAPGAPSPVGRRAGRDAPRGCGRRCRAG